MPRNSPSCASQNRGHVSFFWITGYVGGITAKILSGNINFVFAVYLLNLAIVLVNLAVYFRNVALDKKAVELVASQANA